MPEPSRSTEESLALFRELGNIEGIAFSLDGLAVLLILSQGDQATGRALLEESLALCREVGHKEGIARALGLLGQVALLQGDAVKARSLLEESLVLYREIGYRNMAWVLIVLGRVAACQGDRAAARALYEESLTFDWEMVPSLLPPHLEGQADRVATRESQRGQHGSGGWQRPNVKRWAHPSRLSNVRAMIVRWLLHAPSLERRPLPPHGPRAAL